MNFDFELEDILSSIKSGEDAPGDLPKKENAPAPIAPPKPKLAEQKENPLDDFSREREPEETKKKKPVKVSFAVPPVIKENADRAFEKLKKLPKKRTFIMIGAVILALAVVLCGIKIYQYSKTAYLKKYEQKYDIPFPEGILKEFCDEYGKDQSFAGEILIEDTGTDMYVYAKEKAGSALLEKGSDVKSEQHFRAIALDKSGADLESVYQAPEGFLKSSQSVTFKTLFGEEKYRVISVYYTNTKPKDDGGYVFPYQIYGNVTEKSFWGYEDRLKSRRLYDTGYSILPENYFLTLSVPSDFMPDFRFVVVCVKTDKFDKSETAVPNDLIHYPQAWYDKNKKKNPYYLAGKWYPEIITNAETGETKKLTYDDFK